jgi:FAD/FMN-containing dehydrogenase
MTSISAPSVTAAVRELRGAVRGSVLVAADESYVDARRVWNGSVDRQPAVIVRGVDERDVSVAVRVARERGLPLSVRGGGHDWAGRAIRDGGLVVDLSGMRRVSVEAGARVGTAGGGATTGEVMAAAHRDGLAPVTGTVNAVGLAGLTLGGGYGLLAGHHGLALDNLLGAEVVLADGTTVTANATENPDLFWALRGGGGNFGVATELRYRLHPVGSVLSGLLLFPLGEATGVLRGYRDLLAAAPDELTVMSGFFCGPDGTPLLFLLPVWSGEPARGERVTARLASLGSPIAGQFAPVPYPDVLSQFDGAVVNGRHNEMQTRWLPALTDAAISTITTAVAGITSPFSSLFLHHFHGAASRVPVADTAFALRRDHVLVEIVAAWAVDAGADEGRHRRWTHALSDALAPLALPGGYANLLGAAEGDRARIGFGGNAARLLDVKRRYDPDNVFTAVAAIHEEM